jgi:hypothetical protein
MSARVLLLSTLLGCVPAEPTTPAPRASTTTASLPPLEGCGAGRVLGHTRLDGAPATLLTIGAHRVLVRDDLEGVAVSEPGPTIVATAEVEGGWIFELADGSFATSSEPLGALAPFVVDVPEREATWFADPSAPPRIHRGVLAVVRRDRVYEIDLAGARTIETEWPVTDVLALGGDERLVGLVGGGLMRGPWDALRPVPLRSPWRDWRVHFGRVAVRAGPEWVELDDASLAPRPSRCLLRAKPRAARERVLLALFDRDLRESPSQPTPLIARRRVRLDGAESVVLRGLLFRRAADGALSVASLGWRPRDGARVAAMRLAGSGAVLAPEGACEPLGSDDSGWWIQCGRSLARVGDDDRVLHRRGRVPLRGVIGWWGPCDDGPAPQEPPDEDGQAACVVGGSGELREVRLVETPVATCGSTLYTTAPGRTHAQSLVDGSSRELLIEARSYGVCLPDDGFVVRSREGLVVWRDEPVEHAVPFAEGDGVLHASGRGELAISFGRTVGYSADEGRTWRLVELGFEDELRCGARCEVVSARGRRGVETLPESDVREVRYVGGPEPYPGRRPSGSTTPRRSLWCERSEPESAQARPGDVVGTVSNGVVVEEHGTFFLVTGERRVPLPEPPGQDPTACRGYGRWMSSAYATEDDAGRVVVLTSVCESRLVRYTREGRIVDARRLLPGATLSLHEGEPHLVFAISVDETTRVIAYPIDPRAPPRIWSLDSRARRICRDGERGTWSRHGAEYLEDAGVQGEAVLEITGDDACVSELRAHEGFLVARDGRLDGDIVVRGVRRRVRCNLAR